MVKYNDIRFVITIPDDDNGLLHIIKAPANMVRHLKMVTGFPVQKRVPDDGLLHVIKAPVNMVRHLKMEPDFPFQNRV